MLADVPLFDGRGILLLFFCIVSKDYASYTASLLRTTPLMVGTVFRVFRLLNCEVLSSLTEACSIHMTIL